MGDVEQHQLDPDGLKRLVADMAQGDQNALTAIYDATHRTIYGLAYRLLNDVALAEEIVHDVYLQAWRTARSYSPTRGTPHAWLMIMTRSRALDRLRSVASQRRLEMSLDEARDAEALNTDPSRPCIEDEHHRHVQRVLEKLPMPQRQAIELAYFRGLTHAEIARRLDLPLGTIKTRIRLAIGKLHEHLMPILEAS